MTKRTSYYTLPDGCSLHCSCSSCPYPDCQASLKDLKKRSNVDDMHQKVLDLHSKNVPVTAILQRTGFKDIRSVYKIIREGC
jgi:hypothetical protein